MHRYQSGLFGLFGHLAFVAERDQMDDTRSRLQVEGQRVRDIREWPAADRHYARVEGKLQKNVSMPPLRIVNDGGSLVRSEARMD
ncbi:hypothetical protein SR39_02185 [Methylobacterium radiotolerans]|nr:hypothetical protein SR39_02185 [Methylobacterium radiotolerans]